MAISTYHIAFSNLCNQFHASYDRQNPTDYKQFLAWITMIELENNWISLSTINTGMLKQIFPNKVLITSLVFNCVDLYSGMLYLLIVGIPFALVLPIQF